jgi:hypothetical protein
MKEGRGMGGREDQEKGRLIEMFGGMIDELRGWRAQHGEASFDEIAAQVTPRRRALMGELLEALARQPGSGMVPEGVACERCGQAMEYKGEPGRQIEHYLEGETDLKRAYYYCPRCKVGFFPPG